MFAQTQISLNSMPIPIERDAVLLRAARSDTISVNGKPLVPCKSIAELNARRFAVRI